MTLLPVHLLLLILFSVTLGCRGGGYKNDSNYDGDEADGRRRLFSLSKFGDPKTTNVKENLLVGDSGETTNAKENLLVGDSGERMVVRGVNGTSGLSPNEIIFEINNARPDCWYTITIQSAHKYTKTATLMLKEVSDDKSTSLLVFSWAPIIPGQFQASVHVTDQSKDHETPMIMPPVSIEIHESTPEIGWINLQHRIENKPPCQSVDNVAQYSYWGGDWFGPELGLPEGNRQGWTYVPSQQMNCKIETFPPEVITRSPQMKSIFILGRSVERGIFFSLLDLALSWEEKAEMVHSIVAKCWGRAEATKGNLKIMYQDFRSSSFEDPTLPGHIECHNDRLVKDSSSFVHNATLLWKELFEDESRWPSVVYMSTAYSSNKRQQQHFLFDHHVRSFVQSLPKTWQGTLILGDGELTGRSISHYEMYQEYLRDINRYVLELNDSRVRWLDGMGISSDMKLWNQDAGKKVMRSQHFHRFCDSRVDSGADELRMKVCSNTTELIAQLLLGHALGEKQELMNQIGDAQPASMKLCHKCPACLLPFQLTPYPNMTCEASGKFERHFGTIDCSFVRKRLEMTWFENFDLCPAYCTDAPVARSFQTESDVVDVRRCEVPPEQDTLTS